MEDAPEPGREKRLPTIWAGVFCVLWTFPVDLPLWTLAASRQQQTSSCGPPPMDPCCQPPATDLFLRTFPVDLPLCKQDLPR